MINRKCLTSLGLLSLTLLLGFISLHIMQLFTISKWVGVSIASGIFVVLLILTIIFLGRKKRKKCKKRNFIPYIVIPINGLANGIAASSLFVYLDEFPKLWHTALLFFALCLLFYIYCVLGKLSFFQNHYVICIGVYTLILIAVGVICFVLVGEAIFALTLLCLIPFFAFLLLLVSQSRNFSELIKFGAYCSFAVLALVIFAVIIVLSQGEVLEGMGNGIDGGLGSREKINITRTIILHRLRTEKSLTE